MPVWVAFLRGINLGARNQVAMPALRDALSAAGFTGVRTYLQSGNVVARSTHRSEAGVARSVRAVVAEHFGVDTPVIVRTPVQVADILVWDPFPAAVREDPARVQVLHLSAEPAPDAIRELTEQDWSPDRLAVRGREVTVAYAATMHRSRLQHALVLRRLGVDGTARNWRTLQAVADLARGS